ncbi:SDR family oxidoreductase [Afifella sp. IM 167]|uniref:SDR family oxidoreductase n=1 Tax=Afifella sp. IM 167 TaxID=2033586 RepID=UPI001CCD5FAE|nr:SDR family oxidoreductase [Afifella sp. IM 167]MBZ8132371.1 NAD-dependent dehydratase [Afifella sp. IM 167]
MAEKKLAVIAGSTGVIGNRLARHLAETGSWEVVGLTRRTRPAEGGVRYVAVDLSDARDCRDKLADLARPAHLFYAARGDSARTGEQEPVEANAAMLRHVCEALAASRDGLAHVHAVHGTKYYGSNLGPFKTPAKEDDPRGPVDNFYFHQQDYLAAADFGPGFTWSISRPAGILDPSLGERRSAIRVLGAYAAILRERGEPLTFPGTPASYRSLYQFTDARLLAPAIAFIAGSGQCANQAFNVTNGDYFRWANLWPRLAAHFGMEVGPVRPMKLADEMPKHAAVWARISERAGLAAGEPADFVLWGYGDYIFNAEYDVMSSTTRLRRAGFCHCLDTEDTILELLQLFREHRILP